MRHINFHLYYSGLRIQKHILVYNGYFQKVPGPVQYISHSVQNIPNMMSSFVIWEQCAYCNAVWRTMVIYTTFICDYAINNIYTMLIILLHNVTHI